MLAELFASPLYTAVIACVPALRVESLRAATPLLKGAVPIVEVPFLKVTMPVGVPPEEEVTVAMNVTLCP